jgi:methylated-DNA-[protein]-cysteine S-methyltransferase
MKKSPTKSKSLPVRQPSRPTATKAAILTGRIGRGMSFQEKVWTLCARVPRGKVTTYGAIARALGSTAASRAVGAALGRNPYAPQVPCHRVVAADGKLTGYSGAGGLALKKSLLEKEGVRVRNGRVDVDAFGVQDLMRVEMGRQNMGDDRKATADGTQRLHAALSADCSM